MGEIKEILQHKFPNVNVNQSSTSLNNVNVKSLTDVQQIAHKLCDQLGDQKSFEAYCGIAWKLPEATIWKHLETAINAPKVRTTRGAFFYWLCKQDMKKAPAYR